MNAKRPKATLAVSLNGRPQAVEIPSETNALTLIRDVFKLKGTKEGCGTTECGACPVIVDCKAVNSCRMLAVQLDG